MLLMQALETIPQQPSFPAEDHDSVALVLACHGEEAPVSAEANLIDKSRKEDTWKLTI